MPKPILGLGRYICVSIQRDIFSDDVQIDTPTQIWILPFFLKIRMKKNIMFTTESESNSMVKK
jgi:hypothetical protein